MCSLVHFEVIRLPETLPTFSTQEWFFPRMYSLVSFQAVGTQEALVTLGARVGPDAGVVAQVNGQVARLSETLATVRALERLVARVEALVLQELGVGEEALPAVRAEVRPLARMSQLVSDQRGLVNKTLVALRAAEHVLPGVAALVLLHAALPLEALAAEGAHEGHLLRVDLHVVPETPLVEEPLSALCACVRPLPLMDALVGAQSGSVGKALPAVALVHLFFLVGLDVPGEVAGTAEAQVTLRAFVRTLQLVSVFTVSLHVPHQCRLPGKRPATLGAQVCPVLHVGALVLPLSHQGLEELPQIRHSYLRPDLCVCLCRSSDCLKEKRSPH